MNVITNRHPIVWWSKNAIHERIRSGRYEVDGQMMKFPEGIWATSCPIGEHRDRNKAGWLTIGCVIANPSGYVLVGVDGVWRLPDGSFFTLRPHVKHALQRIDDRDAGSPFIFMAWDMPEEGADPDKLIREMEQTLYDHGWNEYARDQR